MHMESDDAVNYPPEAHTLNHPVVPLVEDVLRQHGFTVSQAAAAALAALTAAKATAQFRMDGFEATLEPSQLASQRLRFLWVLLPEFLEKPSTIAAAAATARGPNRFLHDGKQLRVGHLNLHPNSLSPDRESALRGAGLSGCLAKAFLGSMVSIQVHMPRLPDVLELLDGLTKSSCRCLRKIVDRQSRWRPRELRFDNLSDEQRMFAASITDRIGYTLPALIHIEGPVFALLLRARRHALMAAAEASTDIRAFESPAASYIAERSCSPHFPEQGQEALASRGISTEDTLAEAASCDTQKQIVAKPHDASFTCCLGKQLRTLHLVDLSATDLGGLLSATDTRESVQAQNQDQSISFPCCPNLQKLLLLNLPSAAPGLTSQAIAKFLPQAPKLQELQLDFQYFDPSYWDLDALEALIVRVQAAPSKIKKLTLDWCRLGDAGIRCVCGTLALQASKRKSMRGASAAITALLKPTSEFGIVTELSIAHCEIKDLTAVCEMLETPGLGLTMLDLSANNFGDSEGGKLAQSLPMSDVKELRLRDSQVSEPMPVKTKWSWGV